MNKWLEIYLRSMSDFVTAGLSEIGWQKLDRQRREQDNQLKGLLGQASSDNALDVQGQIANSGLKMTSDQEKYLDNLISQHNTNSARDFEKMMSDTAILRNAEQLEQLGLAANGVLSTGGAQSNGVDTAGQVKSNMAQERYNQKMQNARAMISLAGSLASAGIHGAAISKVRTASQVLASSAANSGLHAEALQSVRQRMIEEEAQRIYDSFNK